MKKSVVPTQPLYLMGPWRGGEGANAPLTPLSNWAPGHLSDPREAPKASSARTQPWLQMDQICALETHQALLYNTFG